MKKKILFLCDASDIDVVEQSFTDDPEYELTIETSEKILQFGVRQYLEQTIERIKNNPDMYDGIVGTHDSSAVFGSIIARETGHRFTPVDAVINCQNKYLCRRIQRSVIPEHTPSYAIALDYLRNPSRLSPPFFIKPVRSNISFGTHKIKEAGELEHFIARESIDIARFNQYYLDALAIDPAYHNALNVATCNTFLCEDLISGTQVTVDGYIFEGETDFLGMTRAVYHPETNSFFYHEFPYTFKPELTGKIKSALQKLIPALGIDNSFFNVELRADEQAGTFKIIEVNCRTAFQFAKTIESVTGADPLRMLCDMATGRRPDKTNTGRKTYASCYNFELHLFHDARILETPTRSAYEEIKMKYPEVHIRNLIHENAKLSDFKHNPESYRYAVVDVPGDSHDKIMKKYNKVISMLGYRFSAPMDEEQDAGGAVPASPPRRTEGGSRELSSQPSLQI
ncbi:MAG: acetyl-CoA carboxylase biotin carboxylase subunit family protein [Desulfobacterales bacterium]